MIYGKQIVRITPEGPVFRNSVFDENDEVTGYEEKSADSVFSRSASGPRTN